MQGKVRHFNQEKGYGFIISDSEDVFFHVSNVIGPEPKKGDIVSYEATQGNRGMQGLAVTVINFST